MKSFLLEYHLAVKVTLYDISIASTLSNTMYAPAALKPRYCNKNFMSVVIVLKFYGFIRGW